jgi:hypothetical protein
MRLLIDTQAVIYYVDQDHSLGRSAHAAISDPSNELLFSAASIWEIAIKVGLKKLNLSLPYQEWMNRAIADLELRHRGSGTDRPSYHGRLRGGASSTRDASSRPIRSTACRAGLR